MRSKAILLFFIISSYLSTAQTTVITHGYSLTDPTGGWMLDMAKAIQGRVGGTIYKYNKATGGIDFIQGTGAHSILIFDWATESTDTDDGYSEQAGAALFTMLIENSLKSTITLNPLHLIGHSRGCAVSSEAAERLIANNFNIEHVTYLDAHDWGQNLGLTTVCEDYDVNPDSIHSGIEGWNGIGWAEAYWQDKSGLLNEQKGRAVEGCYSEYLGKIGHQGMYEWYTQSALDTSIKKGFYYAHNGGGENLRPNTTGLKRNPFISSLTNAIYNGDLEHGPDGADFPGWRYHGGGGKGLLSSNHLELRDGSESKTHDRFYIPINAKSLSFDIQVFKSSATDYVRVKLGNSIILNNYSVISTTNTYKTITIDVSLYNQSVETLTFEVLDQNNTTNNISSEVWIDNIQLLSTSPNNIQDQNDLQSFFVYPSPAINKNEIFINYKTNKKEQLTATIINMLGETVLTQQLSSNAININSIPTGNYIIELKNNDNIIGTKRLTILN